MTIVVCGSLATDHLMTFDGVFAEQLVDGHLDHLSLSFLVEDLAVRYGGVGGNIAYALGLLGTDATLVSAAGRDFSAYRSWLEDAGVDCRNVLIVDAEFTARFTCTTDREHAQIASFYPGAMRAASAIDLGAVIGALDSRVSVVIIGADDPAAMLNHTRYCRQHGVPFAADPSQQLARLSGQEALELVDEATYLLTNEYEFALLQKKTGLTDTDIDKRVETRITTLGARGAQIASAGDTTEVRAVPSTSEIDPTGVGDGFRAGLFAGLSTGLETVHAAQLGATIAVKVLETHGPQGWEFDSDEILNRIETTYGPTARTTIATAIS